MKGLDTLLACGRDTCLDTSGQRKVATQSGPQASGKCAEPPLVRGPLTVPRDDRNSHVGLRFTLGKGDTVNELRLAMAALAFPVAALSVAACRKAPAPPPAAVTITSPTAGDTIRGSAVHIMLDVTGVELAPVADQRPGTAHHHLFLDVDAETVKDPIPVGAPGVVHLGQAQTAFHWDSIAPGRHRIIAMLADPGHVPLMPLVVDTVTFVVVAP